MVIPVDTWSWTQKIRIKDPNWSQQTPDSLWRLHNLFFRIPADLHPCWHLILSHPDSIRSWTHPILVHDNPDHHWFLILIPNYQDPTWHQIHPNFLIPNLHPCQRLSQMTLILSNTWSHLNLTPDPDNPDPIWDMMLIPNDPDFILPFLGLAVDFSWFQETPNSNWNLNHLIFLIPGDPDLIPPTPSPIWNLILSDLFPNRSKTHPTLAETVLLADTWLIQYWPQMIFFPVDTNRTPGIRIGIKLG